MILFKPTNQIYPNRLACMKDLQINTNKFRKLFRMQLLVPVPDTEPDIKQRQNLGKVRYEIMENSDTWLWEKSCKLIHYLLYTLPI